MCGGRGTRLDTDCEKPLFEVGGRPMIDRVLAALDHSEISTITGVSSPATPRTRDHLATTTERATIEAPGEGYVRDLQYALAQLEDVEPPVFTVVADLPLLDGTIVDRVLDRFAAADGSPSLSVCVPKALKESMGLSVDSTREGEHRPLVPSGLNVVAAGDREERMVSWDARLAVNVNREPDVARAEALL